MMAIFDEIKGRIIGQRKADEALYDVVAEELQQGVRKEGLWIKALACADGDKEKQISEYIKLRVQALKDDVTIMSYVERALTRVQRNDAATEQTVKRVSHKKENEERVDVATKCPNCGRVNLVKPSGSVCICGLRVKSRYARNSCAEPEAVGEAKNNYKFPNCGRSTEGKQTGTVCVCGLRIRNQ